MSHQINTIWEETQKEIPEQNKGCEYCKIGVNEDGEDVHWFQNGKPMCPIMKEEENERDANNRYQETATA